MDFAAILIISAILSALLGAFVGSQKGRGGDGFVLGLLLGPFGVITVAAMGYSTKQQLKFENRLASAMGASQDDQDFEFEFRTWAVGEAMRRDPSLTSGDDPATLRRLAAEADAIVLEQETQKLREAALASR